MEKEVRLSKFPLPHLLSFLWHKAEGDSRAQTVGRIALSLVAVLVDVRLVPPMYSARPILALGAFAILILVSNTSREGGPLPRLSATRLAVFAGLHLALVLVANYFAPGLNNVAASYSLVASVLSATKILIVLPTLVLFPMRSEFYTRFASELSAAVIILLLFFPDRYLHLIWPWYSGVLVTGATVVCSFFVPGTYLDQGAPTLTIVGPSVDMVVSYSCSGITGMNLFHLVFGFVAIMEWNRLRKFRALICFVIGGLAYMVANFLRLNLLFLIGNLVSNRINLDFLGWVIFGVTFFILMKVCYDWMVGAEQIRKNILPHAFRRLHSASN